MISEREAREDDYIRRHGEPAIACADCGEVEVSAKGQRCAECENVYQDDGRDERPEQDCHAEDFQ